MIYTDTLQTFIMIIGAGVLTGIGKYTLKLYINISKDLGTGH